MSNKQQVVAETYGEPLADVLATLYHDQGLTQSETAEAIEERLAEEHGEGMDPEPPFKIPRSTISYWFKTHDIETRSTTLSDYERLALLTGFALGVGDGTIAKRVGVGETTTYRYRREIHETGEPVDFNRNFKGENAEFVQRLVRKARRNSYGHGGQ